jgi:AAA15 family ATPase/GTPase
MLIRDLTIKGYRCFEDFSMDGLTRVNLLVGNNNSGKTSFLEAIYLLINQPMDKERNVEKIIKEIFENRNEFRQWIETITSIIEESKQIIKKQYFLDRLFYTDNQYLFKDLLISSQLDDLLSTEITLDDEEYSEGLLKLGYHNNKFMLKKDEARKLTEKHLLFNSDGSTRELYLELEESLLVSEVGFKRRIFPFHEITNSLFLSNYQINLEKVASVWDEIELTPKEDIVIEALRIILPTVDRIGFSVSEGFNNIRLKVKDHPKPIPLSSMGYGMNRILNLAIALVSTEKGVLLVDEIETGLHYEAQLDMWRLVLKTAQDLDVQVFATTHSWDCIAAFKEALQELEDQSVAKLFRLDSKYGKLRAVEYDAEEIRIAVNQGVEVR